MIYRSKTITVLLSKKQSAKVPQIFASVDTLSRKTTRKKNQHIFERAVRVFSKS